MEQSLRLLDEIIELEKAKEKELKRFFLEAHRASLTVGEGVILHHLKNLKELIEQEAKNVNSGIK